MAARSRHHNPFYFLLLVAGIAFLLTSVAYGFMAFQELHFAEAFAARHATHPLVAWLRSYGNHALVVELVALALCTVAAMGTDHYWEERRNRSQDASGVDANP